MVEDTSPKHQRPHLRHEQHQKPHLRQQHLLHQHRGLAGHHQLPLLIHKGTWMSLLVRLLPNSVRYWGFFEQTCLNKTFWRKWTCVHLFLYCWYSWWISSRLLSAVMCVFQSAGMGGWSSWSMRISSSPSSMPWLRQMLCSTQQARMIWQTFSGSYSSLPPDASKHRHLPFSMPMLRSTTDRARACAVSKWAS